MKIFHPRAVHVRLSSSCNLNCNFCERELLPKTKLGTTTRANIQFADGRADLNLSRDMPAEVWEKVKTGLMPHVQNMEIGGLGEPTLAKLFPTVAKDIVSAGKNLFFFSNGTYLHQQRVIDAVGDHPRVSISIDAGTPDAYKRIRGGNLADLIHGVATFKRSVPGATLNSQFTATADNIEELPAWVRLCAELGIGRFDNDEELLVCGADHHVTNRVQKSVRFLRDLTAQKLAEARSIAEQNGLWLISNLPEPSELNPNAIADGSDPKGFRRYVDFVAGDACRSTTGATSDTIAGASEVYAIGAREDLPTGAREVVTAPKELYIDYDGTAWSCLARHRIGDVSTSWEDLVDKNTDYQAFLAGWANSTSGGLPQCASCPRRK